MSRARPPLRVRPRRTGVLILCEGSQTEPNYLDAFARDRGVTSLVIPRNHDTDPEKLVIEANNRLQRDRLLDRAFVVFDTYEHNSYRAALRRALELDPIGDRLMAIPSYPSFEAWLLSHYEYTRAPMSQDEALARLKKHLPHYDKSSAQVMDEIVCELDKAIGHGERARDDVQKTGEANSSSCVHEMMTALLRLSER